VRRTADEAAATRRRILEAARRLFTETGFVDTPLDAIASAAGVTRGALYHHFRDKREIHATLFTELQAEIDAVGRAAAAAAMGRGLRDAFLAGTRAILEVAQRPDLYRIVVVDGPGVLGPEAWHAAGSKLGLPMTRLVVETFMATGQIERAPVEPLAILLLGALNGAAFALARNEPGIDIDSAIAGLARLVDGLAPRAPSS
jgi:AcrR family transcriptional regulator